MLLDHGDQAVADSPLHVELAQSPQVGYCEPHFRILNVFIEVQFLLPCPTIYQIE